MKILVAYESKTGHTQQAAEAIAAAARNLGHQITVKRFPEVNAYDTQTADVLFLGTWVQGMFIFGMKPAGVSQWIPALPSIKGKSVALFCTYAFRPGGALRTLGALLEEQGAVIMGDQAFPRGNPDKNADSFVSGIISAAEAR